MNKLAPRRTTTLTWHPGAVLRPVIGVDIDGTLGQWHEEFLDFARRYLQKSFSIGWSGEGSLHQHMGVSKRTYRIIKLAFRQSGLKRAMRPMPDAHAFAQAMRAAGAELWVCTTRPYLRLDNIDPDTRWWLRHHKIAYDGVLFGERKYRDLIHLVGAERVVGILDDLPEQVEAAIAVGAAARLLERPYNVNRHNGLPTMGSLALAQKHFEQEISAYLRKHNVRGK
jgi:hypothetical protein